MKTRITPFVLCLSMCGFGVAAMQDHEHGSPASARLGTVHFATSCTSDAQHTFDRGIALLHSFEFGPAVQTFQQTLAADPSCAMAEWGIALCRWGNPFSIGGRSPGQVEQGMAAVTHARQLAAKTARERAYVEAVARLYENAATTPQAVRVSAYRDAMAHVAHDYAEDTEASIFYALSLTAAEDPADKSYAGRLKAVAILEPLFAKYPDHPGLAHYIIHSYDVPALAPRALGAARRYAQIAPAAPHALHMPSHTFTRVGLWQESIDTNIASANAAREQHATAEELHATDYEMYAYLQTAQDAAARRLVDALPDVLSRFDPNALGSAAPPSAALYAAAAIPARWTLERGAWAEAKALPLRSTALPYADALTVFAKAVGSARSGDVPAARAAVASLEQLRDREAQLNEPYWTQQIDIARQAAVAWTAFAEHRTDQAIAGMRAAADAEDKTEKAAITPGPLAPAREQLGDMLLDGGDARAALEQYEATLAKEPNRFRALYGAARAAARAGDRARAQRYFAQLVKICERADVPGRPELQEARAGAAGPAQ